MDVSWFCERRKEVSKMLANLKTEMKRSDITISDIANIIKKTDRAVRERIKGNGHFSVPEAAAVRNAFFPGMEIEYLFGEKKPSPERDSNGKVQPGSRAFFEHIKIPGVCVKDVRGKKGTVYVTLVCEDWVDAGTAQGQYKAICFSKIPVGQELRINVEQSGHR